MNYFFFFVCLVFMTAHAAMKNNVAATALTSFADPDAQDSSQMTNPETRSLGVIDRFRLKPLQKSRDNTLYQKLSVCENCHSQQLHSGNSFLPLLQGQNEEYLFAKIQAFKADNKSYHPYASLTQQLSDQEIMDITLYYSTQKSELNNQLALARVTGKDTEGELQRIEDCYLCHGKDGNGDALIPAISGQNINYLGYRIREIARNDSRVHLTPVASVNCIARAETVSSSKYLAKQLSLVIDGQSAQRGKGIYDDNCARCHDNGDEGAPILSIKQQWAERIRQGTRVLIENTISGKNDMPYWGGNIRLSRNQLKDAIQYMVYRLSIH